MLLTFNEEISYCLLFIHLLMTRQGAIVKFNNYYSLNHLFIFCYVFMCCTNLIQTQQYSRKVTVLWGELCSQQEFH